MSEASWLIPVAVAAGGILGGLAMLHFTRPRSAPQDPGTRVRELRAKKERLIEELRALAPDDPARAALELEAAAVLRELDGLGEPPAASAPAPAVKPTEPGAAAPAAAGSKLSPQLAGALKGGAFVALVFLAYLALKGGTSPRNEGMGMTGGTAPAAAGQGATGATQGATQGASPGATAGNEEAPPTRQAPSLAPLPSPRVDAARAVLAAHPDSHEAKVALGWALVDARGWIEVYRLVEGLVDENANDPDALALAAPVQLAMGQRQQATDLLDKVLEAHPDHAQALVWRGRIAQLEGDADAQAEFWRRARQSGDPKEIDAIIASFENAPAPKPHGSGGPSGMPGPAGMPGGAPAPAGGTISGTLALAPGATAPPGATLFLIARRVGATGGPPLATRKIEAPTFPRAFTLGPEDVMMQGMGLTGPLTIEARLDTDGNAMTRDPSDLFAAWPEPVDVGARGIVLELAQPGTP